MYYDIILTQLDEHNETSILLCKKYSPETLLLIYDKDKYDELKIKLIKKICRDNMINSNIKEIQIKKGDIISYKKLLKEYINKKILVNLTVGERLDSLILLNICSSLKYKDCIYIDLLNMKEYFINNTMKVVTEQLQDLKIEDIAKLAGSSIINDSSYLINKTDVINLTKAIVNNLDIWEEYKQTLYDTKIFNHNYKDSSTVIININYLDSKSSNLLYKILNYIKKLGSINYKESKETIEVKFTNSYLKGFIFKSGTWLEVITTIIINEIKAIDESKSGLEFIWSSNSKNVKNELDVVAISDSILVCISCKDSDKYDEDTLNELEVYSTKLGGDKVIKILVASKYPIKKTIIERAKEMNIHIIVIEKDLYSFKSKLINILEKK